MRPTSPDLHGVRPGSEELEALRNRLRIKREFDEQEKLDRRRHERIEQASGLAKRLRQIRDEKKNKIAELAGDFPCPKVQEKS
jgi:hypothetical protein